MSDEVVKADKWKLTPEREAQYVDLYFKYIKKEINMDEIAEKMNCARRTAYDLRKNPKIRALILTGNVIKADRTINEVMDSENDSVRLGAAKVAYQVAGELVERSEVEHSGTINLTAYHLAKRKVDNELKE